MAVNEVNVNMMMMVDDVVQVENGQTLKGTCGIWKRSSLTPETIFWKVPVDAAPTHPCFPASDKQIKRNKASLSCPAPKELAAAVVTVCAQFTLSSKLL